MAKTVKQPPQQPAQPQYANYWAPLTRKRHILPRPAQPQQSSHWAPRGNDTSKSTGHSGRQNAATRRNMRRGERVTVQGPVNRQQPDGMSHRGGGGHFWAIIFMWEILHFKLAALFTTPHPGPAAKFPAPKFTAAKLTKHEAPPPPPSGPSAGPSSALPCDGRWRWGHYPLAQDPSTTFSRRPKGRRTVAEMFVDMSCPRGSWLWPPQGRTALSETAHAQTYEAYDTSRTVSQPQQNNSSKAQTDTRRWLQRQGRRPPGGSRARSLFATPALPPIPPLSQPYRQYCPPSQQTDRLGGGSHRDRVQPPPPPLPGRRWSSAGRTCALPVGVSDFLA